MEPFTIDPRIQHINNLHYVLLVATFIPALILFFMALCYVSDDIDKSANFMLGSIVVWIIGICLEQPLNRARQKLLNEPTINVV